MGTNDCSHFDQIRIQNRRMVRNLMRDFPQIGKAELADLSGLSFPTISALLGDLLQTGEVLLLADVSSRGGRPAEQFALNPLFQTALCAYIENHVLYMRVCDVFGNTLLEKTAPLASGRSSDGLIGLMSDVKASFPGLSVICLGVPGAIMDGYLNYLPDYRDLEGLNLKQLLENALSVPVFIENDVNVFVFAEREIWPDLVHIFSSSNCPGSGILLNRTVVRGASGCAGELEYIPFEHNGIAVTFGEKLGLIARDFAGQENTAAARAALLSCLAHAVASIVCIINPPDLALSGFGLADSDMTDLTEELARLLPASRCPVFHVVDEIDSLYQRGLLEIAMDYWKAK